MVLSGGSWKERERERGKGEGGLAEGKEELRMSSLGGRGRSWSVGKGEERELCDSTVSSAVLVGSNSMTCVELISAEGCLDTSGADISISPTTTSLL